MTQGRRRTRGRQGIMGHRLQEAYRTEDTLDRGTLDRGRKRMAKVFIQAPPSRVFEAMCDLTRHAKWAVHEEAGQRGRPAVGNTYT